MALSIKAKGRHSRIHRCESIFLMQNTKDAHRGAGLGAYLDMKGFVPDFRSVGFEDPVGRLPNSKDQPSNRNGGARI